MAGHSEITVCTDVRDAVDYIRERELRIPEVALILGSGLAHLAATLEADAGSTWT